MDEGAPPTRRELEALQRRLETLERMIMPPPAPGSVRCARCQALVPPGRFCASCGTPLAASTPPPTPSPIVPAAPPAAPRVAPAPAAPAAPKLGLEGMLGQRFAPRLGAGLVFLGVVFFLGVAVQRGWIGPLAQLAIAVLAAGALLAAGAWLTARRGYGTYPQVLEATGACILYLTAFVAHALPYYRAQTQLTELGGAFLMAIVALATVALALWRDARVIAGLGFGLAFLTALFGLDVLPALTVGYVALLGTGLAALVARKGWIAEGVLGTLATGALLLSLAWRAEMDGSPPAAMVALVSLAPALAFLWLAARPSPSEDALPAILTLATFAWAGTITATLVDGEPRAGVVLLAWALAAAGHAWTGARVGAAHAAVLAAGVSGVVFWLLGAPFAWSEAAESELLATATYASGAVALAIVALRVGARGVWLGALVLGLAAAAHALFVQQLLMPPWEPAAALGPWQAWATLVLVLAPLVLATARSAPEGVRAGAFWSIALFATLWAFALFGTPFLATAWLILVAGALVATSIVAHERAAPVAQAALLAALLVLLLAALKGATLDSYAPEVRLDALAAGIQALALVGALLALFHAARTRALFPRGMTDAAAAALVGGSAAIVANYLLAYTEGAATSILLGLAGVAYLTAGFLRRLDALYRYAGFAILGFVVLRVFLVDLRTADLALRALVFAVLGAILLGIGYAYARRSRKAG